MGASAAKRRFPAEWEPHDATWLAWPHNEEDWPGKFGPIEWVFCEIARGVVGSAGDATSAGSPSEPRASARAAAGGSPTPERLDLLCHDEVVHARAMDCLTRSGVDMSRVRLHLCPTDRGWMRDCGPTFIESLPPREPRAPASAGSLAALDWRFNAWAKYDNWRLDDVAPRMIEAVTGIPRLAPMRHDAPDKRIVLEGGGVETDGAGTLLVTEEWLLHPEVQVRNPGLTREGYEAVFREWMGIEKTIWLGRGCVGDDTHGHIDDIARFAPPAPAPAPAPGNADGPSRVLLAFEDNTRDENHSSSVENEARLRDSRDASGKSLEVVRLPYPDPVIFDGQRLPASYANFYVCNRATLVPIFGDAKDALALATIARCFPDRPVVPISSRDLVWGLGTIHCLTQQQPLKA